MPNPQTPPAPMPDGGIVVKLSPRSVPDTVARLSDLVSEKGLKPFALIDHSGEAEAKSVSVQLGWGT